MRVLLSRLAVLLVLLLAASPCGAQDAPRAVGGVVDFTAWNFNSRGPVELTGEWRFDDGLIVQPGAWNKRRPDIPALGRHTLGLTILLPPDAPLLALAVPDVNSAFRLSIGGVPVRAVGQVGDGADLEVPVVEKVTLTLPAGITRIDLALDVSNHNHFEGGVTRAFKLGPKEVVFAETNRLKAVPLMAFGALVTLVLLLPAFWLGGKREPVFLIFAAFSALVAWRTFAAGQLYTMLGQDLRADWWYLPAAYISLYIFPGMYLGFLRALFPTEVPRWVAWPAYAVSGAMTALVLVAEPAFYTQFRDPFQACILLTPLAGAIMLGRALLRHRDGAAWVLAGSLLLSATVVNDSLHYQRVIASLDLVPLGFAAFGLCYCAALALRLFRAERTASLRLAALNRELEGKVSERTASLEEAKAAAEQASHAKSEFLAVMSHEIRTPLHGWAGLTELLEKTPLDDTQRHYVGLLRHTAAHLTQLMGNILDMSRIEAGRLELDPEPIALVRFVTELGELGRAQATAKGLSFHVSMGDGLPACVAGDAGAIRQIVLNFLGNAAKFTSEGEVRLDVFRGEHGIRLQVSDTGCGIPADRQDEIFETFTQVDASSRRSHGGSGLGLAICRRLAELMGGSVGVRSAHGVGTVIWCELPLPECDPPAQEAFASVTACALPPGTRLLLADDAELNRLVLRQFLAGTGAIIDEAADGAEALAKVEANQYDLVVLDLRMPGMDGFEAARAIRARERRLGLAPLPLVALTAGAAPADRRLAEDAGFTAFLAKPIDCHALITALAGLQSFEAVAQPLPPPPDIPEGLEHMLPLFVAEMERDAQRLESLASASLSDLAEHAHAMRGKAAMFGEDILFRLLTQAEHEALAGRGAELPALITSVVERATQLREYQANDSLVR